MKKIFFLPIILGAAACISFAGLLASEGGLGGPGEPDVMAGERAEPAFTYYDVESVSAALERRGGGDVALSVPVAITDKTISKYCTYYDKESGEMGGVTYCTTSGMTDRNGITVGNLNIGGDIESPVVAIAALDPVPPVGSGRGHAVLILESVIEGLVCDCWEEKSPGGFSSVSDWMSEIESVVSEGMDAPHLKSTISGLSPGVEVTLEATQFQGGYQWTLVILQ